MAEGNEGQRRVRREPPRFRAVKVKQIAPVSPRLVSVTLAGPELDGFLVDQPGSSVRLLLPPPGLSELVYPVWNGNEFRLPDGQRPGLRTFTPRRVDPAGRLLEVQIVMHAAGLASAWVRRAQPGDPVAVSGPGRGYTVDPDASHFFLAGDETAIPAISQLLEVLPSDRSVDVHVEVADPSARVPLSDHPGARVSWSVLPADAPPGDTLLRAVQEAVISPETRVWAAGEAAAVQRIRRHLFESQKVPRSRTSIRGYWKFGRSGDADTDL